MTEALISRVPEIDIDAKNIDGISALHMACFTHNEEIVRMLIEAGTDVNINSLSNERPLSMMQRENNLPLLRLLVNAGAQINFQDDEGESPLHEAAGYGVIRNVQYLINHGANLTLREQHGLTPAEFICYCQNSDERLVAVCLPGSCQEEDIRRLQRLFQRAEQQDNEPDSSVPQINDLWGAIVEGSVSGVQSALDCDCLELQSVTQSTTEDWIEGETALHLAVLSGNLAVCEALLNAGAESGSRNALRNTPLHLAAIINFVEVIARLLEYPLRIDEQNSLRQSALHLASFHGSFNATQVLLQNGATVSLPDAEGFTPIDVLCGCLHNSECPTGHCSSGQDIRTLAGLFGDQGSAVRNQMIDLYYSGESSEDNSDNQDSSDDDDDETKALGWFIGILFLCIFAFFIVYIAVIYFAKKSYFKIPITDRRAEPGPSTIQSQNSL